MRDQRPSRAPSPLAFLLGWRVALRRHRWPRVVLVVAVGLIAGHSVEQARTRADDARLAWGSTATVWVARHDLAAGTVLGPDDAEQVGVPARLRPADAADEDPRGERLRHPLAATEIIRRGRLTSGAQSDIASRLGPDRVALTVDTGGALLAVGDLVALHDRLSGERLTATAAEIVAVGEGLATVAMEPGEVAAVVATLTTGGVVPVVTG